MEDILFEEFNTFIELIENGKLDKNRSNNFLDIANYEDEFSHNEIEGTMTAFYKMAKQYLKANFSGEYGMHCDFCVHIYTKEFLEKKELNERYLVI